ncbi:phage-related protein [Agrobacterium vitis]|nr:phage-related protein [Agrobacterium vitis]MBE1440543.1 phage-related protein [Agrobacterium vitis]
MANRNMNLDVIVRLKDLLSGPLRGLKSALSGVADMAKKIGVVGAAVAGISFLAPIQEAAAFQQQLLDIAGTSNLVGDAAFAYVGKSKEQFETLALEIGQLSDTVAKGAGQMIAAGVDPKLVDASVGRIGRAATAANAEFADMAGVATSLLTTLKLPADQLDGALGGLVVAGKEGAFELKDMAKYFPTLTSQMAKFGVTGREAVNFLGAGLQIARKGTADPAEAANNLKNFLSKILAPATIKNFKDMGVDIEGVMKDAATKGINPIEAVVQKITKLTGISSKEVDGMMKKAKAAGMTDAEALKTVREQIEKTAGAGKLGQLFGDMQVMDFLLPMLGNIDEYQRIKGEVAKATGSVIDADFETQMAGLNRQLITFREIGAQGAREVGFAFGEWLPMINENLAAALKWLRELDASTGGMVKKALMFAGAGVLMAAGLGALGVVLPIIGAGLSAIAALLSPIGLAIAAVGFAVWDNWSSIGPALKGLWTSVTDTVQAAIPRLKEIGTSLLASGRELLAKYGPMIAKGFSTAWGTASDYVRAAIPRLQQAGMKILAAGKEMVSRYGPVLKMGFQTAWRDVSAGFMKLGDLFKGFARGLDLKFDTSGLTIDNAKIAAFKALDVAMAGVAAAWAALKDFGSGFAPYLSSIGENLGGTIKAIVEIASGIWRLVKALASLIGLDQSKASGFFTWLGSFAGGAIDVATFTIRTMAEALAQLITTMADLAEGKVSWESLIPQGVSEAWKDASTAVSDFINSTKTLATNLYDTGVQAGKAMVDGIIAAFDNLVAWFKGLPGRIREAIGKIDLSSIITMPSLPSWLGGGGPTPPAAANENALPATALPASASPTTQPAQQLNVNTTATVKVDGPGQVSSQATSVTSPSPNVNTGRVVGRD